MARAAFLALTWAPADPVATAGVEGLVAHVAETSGWRLAVRTPGAVVWVDDQVGLPVLRLPQDAGVVVGDVWPMPGAPPLEYALTTAPGAVAPSAIAERLCRHVWGRYVALLPRRSDGATLALRDPSGQLPCLTWSLDIGIEVVTSDPTRLPGFLRPRRSGLNWDRIANFVAMLSSATVEPLLDGYTAVGPGGLCTLGRGDSEILVWRPGDFAQDLSDDPEAAAAETVRRVDACTAALAGGHPGLIMELSGGLDSSIVAASLGVAGLSDRVAYWLNRAGDRAEGDERAYARAVTDRLGVPLTVVEKPLEALSDADFTELGAMFWPGINAVDPARDRDEVARIRDTGVTGLVSGDGGDAVFLQPPSALVWDDELRRRGLLRALASPVLPGVARRTRQSVWGVMGQVMRARRGRGPPLMAPSRFASPDVQRAFGAARHSWVLDAETRMLPAGKRRQIHAIANCQVFRGESRRTQEADLLFPLMAQPVVEHCLAIGTPDLAGGPFDRPFERAAFAARLPEAVRLRRAKGNLGSYFCQLVAASLPTLRPYLLDGCLAEARVLDRGALDRALDPAQLIWGTRGNELLILAAVEAWVRHWQGRLPDSPSAPRWSR